MELETIGRPHGVRQPAVWYDARIPFGGVKNSGFERELSEAGFEEFVNTKLVNTHPVGTRPFGAAAAA